jgi:hypothetical protein
MDMIRTAAVYTGLVAVLTAAGGCASNTGSQSASPSGPDEADVAAMDAESDEFQAELANSTGGDGGSGADKASQSDDGGARSDQGGSAGSGGDPSSQPAGSKQSTSGPGRPDWVTQPPSRAGMAYGVGSAEVFADPASALNRARDKARAEMVKALRVQVQGSTQTSTKRTVEDGESTVTRSLVQNVKNSIPEVELSNVRILRTHVDESDDMAYALAALDREAEADSLAQRVAKLDEDLKGIAGKSLDGQRLDKLRTALPALEFAQERRQVVEKLRLVSPQNRSDGVAADRFSSLENEVMDLVGDLRVVLEPANRNARRLESALREALTKEGVNIYSRDSEGDITLRYDFSLNTEKKDNFFVFADGSVSVVDGSGRIIDEFRANVKGVSTREGVARSRAMDQLASSLGKKLAASLLESL